MVINIMLHVSMERILKLAPGTNVSFWFIKADTNGNKMWYKSLGETNDDVDP